MARKIALLLAGMLSIPQGAQALGLGKLETTSRLNEPFEARIALVGATPDELESLRVVLADSAQFARAGVEFAAVLSRLRFEVVQPERGGDHIRVYSREPLQEPFINFLLEVNWAQGRFVREYTVLLDPPLYEMKRAPAVQPAQVQAAAPTPVRPSEPAAAAARETPGSWTVRDGESLWGIAGRFAGEGVSRQQMVAALYRANPEAFSAGNMNNLKRGAVLRVPDAAEARALSQSEALALINEQQALWEDMRKGVTRTTAERPAEPAPAPAAAPAAAAEAVTPAGGEGGELKLVTPAEAPPPSEPQAPDAGALANELALTTEQLASKTAENADLEERLRQAEALVAELSRLVNLRGDELAALQARLAAGETLPADAQPQTGAGGEATPGPGSAEAGAAPGEPTPAVGPEVATAEATGTTEAAGTTPTSPTPAAPAGPEPVLTPAPAEPTAPAEASAPAATEEPASPVATPAPEAAEAPAAVEPEAPAPAAGLPDWLAPVAGVITALVPAGLLASIPGGVLGVLAGLAVLVLLLALLLARGRRTERVAPAEARRTVEPRVHPATPTPAAFDQTLPATGVVLPTPVAPPAQPESGGAAPAVTLEAPSAPAPVAPPVEEDPLAEVNVYLAYERFDQAADLVKAAIARNPGEHKFKLRLLEVYYSSNDTVAYEQAARALFDAVGGQGPLWDSAQDMWREMSPTRALFAPQTGAAPEVRPRPESAKAFIDLTDAGSARQEDALSRTIAVPPPGGAKPAPAGDITPAPAPTQAASGGAAEAMAAPDFLDLTAVGPEQAFAPEEFDTVAGGRSPLDLTSEPAAQRLIAMEETAPRARPAPAEATPAADTHVIDFDLGDTQAPAATTVAPTPVSPVADANVIDFDLGLEEPQAKVPAPASAPAPAPATPDDNVIEFEPSAPARAPVTPATPEPAKAPGKVDDLLDFDLDALAGGPPAAESAPTATPESVGAQGSGQPETKPGTTAFPALEIDLAPPTRGGEPEAASAEGLDVEFDVAGGADLDRLAGEAAAAAARRGPVATADDTAGSSPVVGEVALEDDGSSLEELSQALEGSLSGIQSGAGSEAPEIDFILDGEEPAAQPAPSAQSADSGYDAYRKTVIIPRGGEPITQSHLDEVDTKLSLAKAYEDLGDASGARAIYEEVALEGTPEQQAEARRRLGALA